MKCFLPGPHERPIPEDGGPPEEDNERFKSVLESARFRTREHEEKDGDKIADEMGIHSPGKKMDLDAFLSLSEDTTSSNTRRRKRRGE